MKKLFKQIGDALKEKYPNIPKIGMAHLHAQGTEINDAERDIQIGNQDGIASSDLDQFDYLALGHIHTGQTVIKGKVQYASSPISLGFTENNYNHKVVLLNIDNNKIIESEIRVPKQRSLYQLHGTMGEIEGQIKLLKKKYPLQVLLDIKIEEEKFDPTVTDRLEALKVGLATLGHMKIINNRIIYKDKTASRFSSTYNPQTINELQPEKVFKDLIANRDEAEQAKLLTIFSEILSDTTQA
jgi:exonuclease SbcD